MQLPLSADVLVPVGVGVLVAVVAVILLVFGLRQRAEDASVPTDADWTSEHVGEVAAPPTRTVADAVAARQGNTGPFVVVAPKQPGAVPGNEHAEQRNGNGRASSGAAPLSTIGPVVSASMVARSRAAVRASAQGARVALAEPAAMAAAERAAAAPEPGAVEGSATDTGLRAQAGHACSGDDADRPAFPADPLFGAGRFDQVGPDGDPWFTPPAMPRTPRGGPGGPAGPEEEPSAASDGPTPADPDLPVPARTTAGQAVDPRPPAARPAPARTPQTPDPARATPAPAGHPTRDHAGSEIPQGVPRPPASVHPVAHASEPVLPASGGDTPGSAPLGPASVQRAVNASEPVQPASGGDTPESASLTPTPARGPSADPPDPAADRNAPRERRAVVPEPAPAPERHPGGIPTRYPAVNVPEPASAPDRHHHADEAAPGAGSSQSVAAAVAQVLAARAAAHAPDGDRRGDARDRLLAVLLDDPLRAVGATVDLQDCQERLDRLAASLQDERARLGDVLGRLAHAGLRPDQLARLSGLSDAEVAELLRRGPSA